MNSPTLTPTDTTFVALLIFFLKCTCLSPGCSSTVSFSLCPGSIGTFRNQHLSACRFSRGPSPLRNPVNPGTSHSFACICDLYFRDYWCFSCVLFLFIENTKMFLILLFFKNTVNLHKGLAQRFVRNYSSWQLGMLTFIKTFKEWKKREQLLKITLMGYVQRSLTVVWTRHLGLQKEGLPKGTVVSAESSSAVT